MNFLSLFDGLGGARIALDSLGITGKYFASEIDKWTIAVAKHNYPDITHIGDITQVHYINGTLYWDGGSEKVEIDLVIGGSPCQGFSFSGKGLNFDDPRSKLFFEYVRLLKEINPKYFLLENVKMKKTSEQVITETLGVEPVLINSSLVSAQNRERFYWTNLDVKQPKDRGILWTDVRQYGLDDFYYSPTGIEWIGRHGTRKNKTLRVYTDKMQMVEASHYKNYSSQRFFGIPDTPKTPKNQPLSKYPDVFPELGDGESYRYITPLECERLQTVPDNYTQWGNFDGQTKKISNTQRYKMLGNGFTVDVIAHILRGMTNVLE